jgi:hypothetical protein
MNRTSRNHDCLSRANEREVSVLILDERSEDVLSRRSRSELVDLGEGGGKFRRGSRTEEETLDRSLDEEFGASFGGVTKESNDSSLLLAARAAVTAESAVVLVATSVLLYTGRSGSTKLATMEVDGIDAREFERLGNLASSTSRPGCCSLCCA